MNGRLAVGVGVGAVVLAFDQVTKEVFESRPCGDVIYPNAKPEPEERQADHAGGEHLCSRSSNKRRQTPSISLSLHRCATIPFVAGVGRIRHDPNLIDRVLLGSVRDFLAYPGNTVVNVADVSIAIGLVLAVVALLAEVVKSSAN